MQINRNAFLILMLLCAAPAFAFAAITLSGNVTFDQNLAITGALSKGSGTFVIDHPLKPATHLLYHSFVESPKVMNIYDGEVKLDREGTAQVRLPAYFKAINTDISYHLTPKGRPMPDLFISKEFDGQTFEIGKGAPGGRVYWQVSATRRDPYILANPVINEVPKSDVTQVQRGECLYEPLCE